MITSTCAALFTLLAAAPPEMDLQLNALTGAESVQRASGSASERLGGLDTALMAELRYRFVVVGGEVGAVYTADGSNPGMRLNASLGVAHRFGWGLRVELDGLAGFHDLPSSTIASRLAGGTTLPSVGLRVGLFYNFFGDARNHLTVGLVSDTQRDLGVGPSSSLVHDTSLGATLTLGWTHDLGGGT